MTKWLMTGASLMVLAACSGSADPVGENSAGSVKTTAMGNVVGTIPSPTPTPTAETSDLDAAIANNVDAMADNSM